MYAPGHSRSYGRLALVCINYREKLCILSIIMESPLYFLEQPRVSSKVRGVRMFPTRGGGGGAGSRGEILKNAILHFKLGILIENKA